MPEENRKKILTDSRPDQQRFSQDAGGDGLPHRADAGNHLEGDRKTLPSHGDEQRHFPILDEILQPLPG
jgi:hypothetical protein